MADEWYQNNINNMRGYQNINKTGTQAWPEYNPNLFKGMGHGRFDMQNMRLPSNLSRDMGASTYQAPPIYPGQRNIHEGFGTADVSSTFQAPEKTGILQNIKNWSMDKLPTFSNLARNVMTMGDATNKNSPNYNPALQGQIDFMKDQGKYGVMDQTGLNKITRGALQGKNLQSFAGSNDLIDMYNNYIAKQDETLKGLTKKEWGQKAYDRKIGVFKQRRDDAILERNAAIAAAKAADAPAKKVAAPVATQTHSADPTYGGGYTTQGGFTGTRGTASQAGTGRGHHSWRAEGGRIGYRDGEFVDENINIQGPGFDVNENVEMAEADPFEMRIQELMSKGLSYEDAYDIAEMEFQDEFAEGPEQDQEGIASLV